MLQDMDHTEARCIFDVMVGMFDQLEQTKVCVLTVTTLEILPVTIHHDFISKHCFM